MTHLNTHHPKIRELEGYLAPEHKETEVISKPTEKGLYELMTDYENKKLYFLKLSLAHKKQPTEELHRALDAYMAASTVYYFKKYGMKEKGK